MSKPDYEFFRNSLLGHLIFLTVEGNVELGILQTLLENGCLVCSSDDLFNEEIVKIRSAKNIEKKLNGYSYSKPITVIRVLDSKKENFKLTPILKEILKDSEGRYRLFNIITAPEIDILFIIAEGKMQAYNSFVKKNRGTSNSGKPSSFCKIILKSRHYTQKNENFTKEYFGDPEKLTKAIREYDRITKDEEFHLSDLLDIQ